MNHKMVLDCDGILLDYVTSFINWVEKEYDWILDETNDYSSYSMESWFTDKSKTKKMNKLEFQRLIDIYNSYPRVIPPIEGSVQAVESAKEKGVEIIVVTSFGGTTGSSEFRKDYLNMLYNGCFDDIIILDLGVCKGDIIKSIQPYVFIDDYDGHLQTAIDIGVPNVAGLKTSYNGNVDGAYYFNKWEIFQE